MPPFETLFDHRQPPKADPSRNVLIKWTGKEARILRKNNLPTQYYVNPLAHGGLGNTPGWLVQIWISQGKFDEIRQRIDDRLELPPKKK